MWNDLGHGQQILYYRKVWSSGDCVFSEGVVPLKPLEVRFPVESGAGCVSPPGHP